jgi:PTH1 family peptidyl-tRNA hydrolase
MKLIVGLGNPGPHYELTRHNIGFLALDRIAEDWHAGPWIKKFNGEFCSAESPRLSPASSSALKSSQQAEDLGKILLLKPQTFMNASGKSVGALAEFYQLSPKDILVIHDELDLDPLVLRAKVGGGAGGHNGLKSIDASLGAGKTGYARLRLGIGHPARQSLRISPADYVLQRMREEELDQLDPFFSDVVQMAAFWAHGQLPQAMNLFHAKGSKHSPVKS